MRAMRAEQFSGYEGLKLVDLSKPAPPTGKYWSESLRLESHHSSTPFFREDIHERKLLWFSGQKGRALLRTRTAPSFQSVRA